MSMIEKGTNRRNYEGPFSVHLVTIKVVVDSLLFNIKQFRSLYITK